MARLFYSEFPPAPRLIPFVDCYWSLTVEADGPGTPSHWVLPDGCLTLSIEFGPRFDVRFRPPALRPLRAPCLPGQQFAGVRFRPGAAAGIELDAVRSQLLRALDSRITPADAFAVAGHVLSKVLADGNGPDGRIAHMVDLVRASAGSISVERVAEEVGVSSRQLERLCVISLGLRPKAFARVSRLQAAVHGLIASERPNLAGIAAEFGYVDQTHMTREFVQLGELRPSEYLRMVSQMRFSLNRGLPAPCRISTRTCAG